MRAFSSLVVLLLFLVGCEDARPKPVAKKPVDQSAAKRIIEESSRVRKPVEKVAEPEPVVVTKPKPTERDLEQAVSKMFYHIAQGDEAEEDRKASRKKVEALLTDLVKDCSTNENLKKARLILKAINIGMKDLGDHRTASELLTKERFLIDEIGAEELAADAWRRLHIEQGQREVLRDGVFKKP